MAEKIEVSATKLAEKLDKAGLSEAERAVLHNIIVTALEAGDDVEGFLWAQAGAGVNTNAVVGGTLGFVGGLTNWAGGAVAGTGAVANAAVGGAGAGANAGVNVAGGAVGGAANLGLGAIGGLVGLGWNVAGGGQVFVGI